MAKVLYNISNGDEFQGASLIFPDGTVLPVAQDHPHYKKLIQLLLADADESEIFPLAAPFEAIFKNLVYLSDRVSRKANRLFFDGSPINTGIAQIILTALDAEGFSAGSDATWRGYVNFLENLAQNPSKASQEHLYKFVEKHGLTITPQGMIVGYKAVNDRHLSTHAGYGIVRKPDGTVTVYENDYLPNEVGYVVEIPREMVDDNRGVACSTGLHFGSHRYASKHSTVLLTVEVNPRDVVAVPSDSNDEKVRASRYKVLGLNDDKRKFASGVLSVEEVSAPTAEAYEQSKVLTSAVVPAQGGSRVSEYEKLIQSLIKADPNANLKRYRSKRITSGRRDEFTQAAANLGYKL